MQLIYIHGLNSSANSAKGRWLDEYCSKHYSHVTVVRPDLNMPPLQVVEHVSQLIQQDSKTMLMGSSLGGFFTIALVAQFNVPAVLLNPSVRTFESLTRFANGVPEDDLTTVLHSTEGGWHMTRQHLLDLKTMYQEKPQHAQKCMVQLQTGDEVLDYRLAQEYFSQDGVNAQIVIHEGGNHRMSNFKQHIPSCMEFLLDVV